MKVKAIYIYEITGPNEEKVTNRLQAWLNDNPSAKIEHVTQTAFAYKGTTRGLMVTIFYRD